MQTSLSDAGQLRKSLTVTLSQDDIQQRRSQIIDRYGSRMQLKGFRPGKKAPRSLVEKRLGPALDEETIGSLCEEAVQGGLKEHNLRPIGGIDSDPQSTDEAGAVSQVFHFDVHPAITLPEPASISVSPGSTEVSDAEIEAELQEMAQRSGSYQELGAEDALGDETIITLSGSIVQDGSSIREMQDLQHMVGAYPLLGMEPAAMIEAVSSLHVGDVLEFDTTLPESFTPEEYAGQAAHVALTIQQARRLEPAKIDDAFAQRLGTQDLEDLKARLGQMVEGRKREALHNTQSEEVMNQLLDTCSFELPEHLLEQVIQQRYEEEEAKQANKKEGEEAEEPNREAIREEVVKELRRHLILDAIAEQQQTTVTEQDVNQQIAMAAYQSGRKPEDIAKQLKESGQIQQVAAEIRVNKAFSSFVESVVQAQPASNSDDESAAPEQQDEAEKAAEETEE